MAKSTKAQLLLAHVVSPVMPLPGDGYLPPEAWDILERRLRAATQKELTKLAARARKAGVRARALLLDGAPADAIIAAARRQRADMIVVGTHGRTGLARMFLGSVASRVVAGASCPVLTVNR